VLSAKARRIAKKLECHYTPKHGSWLNTETATAYVTLPCDRCAAGVELAVLAKHCLDRRLPDSDSVRREVGAWECEPNDHGIKVHWRFCSTDARAKLPRPYPGQSP